MITVTVEHYAALRDQAGCEREELTAELLNPAEVYTLLADRHTFTLQQDNLKVAVNDTFVDWSHQLTDGDKIVFIPPVSGG